MISDDTSHYIIFSSKFGWNWMNKEKSHVKVWELTKNLSRGINKEFNIEEKENKMQALASKILVRDASHRGAMLLHRGAMYSIMVWRYLWSPIYESWCCFINCGAMLPQRHTIIVINMACGYFLGVLHFYTKSDGKEF